MICECMQLLLQSECDTVIVHISEWSAYVCMSQLSEDVKASCVSYGHTSTIHSRGVLVHDHKPG